MITPFQSVFEGCFSVLRTCALSSQLRGSGPCCRTTAVQVGWFNTLGREVLTSPDSVRSRPNDFPPLPTPPHSHPTNSWLPSFAIDCAPMTTSKRLRRSCSTNRHRAPVRTWYRHRQVCSSRSIAITYRRHLPDGEQAIARQATSVGLFAWFNLRVRSVP